MKRGLALAIALALVGCDKPAAPPPPPARVPAVTPRDPSLAEALPGAVGSGDAIGTPAEVDQGAIVDPRARWAIVCQMRKDTNHDGKIERVVEAPFASGDEPQPYLVVGGGAGAELASVVATAAAGDYLVVETTAHAIALVDVPRARVTTLAGAIRAAAFSADGAQLVYLTRDHVVRRELATGASHAVALPAGDAGAVVTDGTGRWAMVAIARDPKQPTFSAGTQDRWMLGDTEYCSNRALLSREWTLDRVWIDLAHDAVRTGDDIVRPAGDHVFTRTAAGLALDGAPVGPQGCAELSVLGIAEAPPRALVRCGAAVTFGATPVPGASPDAAFEPVPPVLAGRETCLPAGDHDVCIDLATAATRAQPTPPRRQAGPDAGGYIYAFDAAGRALVAPVDPAHKTHGPLRWRP